MSSRTEMSKRLIEDDFPGLGRYVWRPADGLLEWSPGLVRIFGRSAAPASEAEFMACLHPDDRVRIEGETEAFLTGEADSHSHSFRILRPDGEVRYIIDRVRLVRDGTGRVTEVYGLNIDVTDFPHLSRASMDDESSALTAELADLARAFPDRDRLEFGQRTSDLVVVDIDYRAGTFTLAPAGARLFGLGDEAMTVPRGAVHATFHPKDREALEAQIRAALDPETGGQLIAEHRILRPDGSVRWLRARKRIDFATIDGRRRPDRGILAVVDVTERKLAETGLRESGERLALAQKVAGIGVWDVNLRDGGAVWTEALYDLFQIDPRTPASPDLFFDRVHPVDEPPLRRAFEASIAQKSPFREEFRVVLPDGEVRHMIGQGSVIEEEDGHAVRVLGVNYDITERKRAETQLRESEARYRALFDSINAGFCVVEVRFDTPHGRTDYRVVEANPAFYDRTGFPKAILGRWLREAAPALEEHWYEIYGGVARSGEPVRFEEHSRMLGRWFDVFAFQIDRPEDGRVAILFHDISERKRYEEHVRTLLKEVNHRSKNMLALVNVIAKRTASLGMEGFIERFSQRIGALATNQDILVRSEWKQIPLRDLVRSQLAHFEDVLNSRIQIAGSPLALSPDAAEKLGMALHELATNAGKYGALSNEAGRIRIDWRTEGSGARDFVLEWREEFGPAVSAPTRNGFGSLVSGHLLETALNGAVDADYAAEGLRWRFRCPLHAVAAAEQVPDAPDDGAEARGDPAVLVVEDDVLLAMSVAESLKTAGLDVIGPARTADAALALIERTRPDFAVLDVNLGKETSERVAQELRRIGVAFLCVSGFSADQLPEAFRDVAFLPKPFDDRALLKTIAEALV